MRSNIRSAAALGLSAALATTHAQTAAPEPTAAAAPATRLTPITVTATRTERRADEVPASVSVLTSTDLQTTQRQNVYEALRDVEGLDFGYAGSVAHQVAPTIRGVGASFAGSTTQMLVNGMAHDTVVSSLLGHGGLNFTALHDVERVEVVRGPVSALYGPGVIGGVINLIPKRWKGGPGATLDASYGTHDTRTLAVAVGTAGENHDLRVSAHDARSDGFITIPEPDAYGQKDYGPRDWHDRKLGVQAGWRPAAQQEFTLGLQTFATRSAALGGRPNERHDLDGTSGTLGYRHAWSNTMNVQALLRFSSLEQKFSFDEEDWNGDTGNFARAYDGSRSSDTTGLLVQWNAQPLTGNALIVGYAHDDGDYETRGTPVGGRSSTTRSDARADALFVQDEQRLGAWTLTAGLRYDRFDFGADTVNGTPKNGSASIDHVLTPRLGLRWLAGAHTSFYATAGRGYLPALNSFKFVQPSTTRVDNPGLDAERSITYEIGADQTLGASHLRAALYHTDYRDKIALGTDVASGKRQWQNIAVVEVDGLEFAWEDQLGHGWRPYANFSYTRARDYPHASGPGTPSLRVAPRKLNAGLTYAPSGAWSITVNARAVSGKYFNALTPAQRAAGYAVVDAKLRLILPMGHGRWAAYVAGNNLGDRRYSEWNRGEYADGRSLTVGLSGAF